MRKVLLVLALLALAIGPVCAQAFFDDFENGTGGWTQYGSTTVVVSTAQNHTPNGVQSVEYPAAAVNYQTGLDKIITDGFTNYFLDFWFYDSAGQNATGMRSYLQLHSYSGGGGSGDLQQLLSFGAYNSGVDQTKYNIRIAVGGAWGNLNTARSEGWHHFRAEANSGTLSVYVDSDDAVVYTGLTLPAVTRIRIGSGLTTNNLVSYYDDVAYGSIPEPGSLLAFATGLVGFIGLAIRRRS